MTTDRAPRSAGRRAQRPGIAYVEQIFALMHPASEIRVRRRPGGRHARAWALVPTQRNPTLLVPTRPRAAAIAALDELGSRGHRALMPLARLVASLGGLGLLPRLTVSDADAEDLVSVIAGAVGDPEAAVSLVVGRTRALQKPVLRVIGAAGATLGYAKVGVSPVTRELVRHETAVLRGFAAAPPVHFRPPRVIGSQEWGELTLLVQEPLPARGRADAAAVQRAAVEISQTGDVATTRLVDGAAWQDLARRVSALPPESRFAHDLDTALERIVRRSADTRVRVGRWHGDFAPWNMASDGVRLHVWDWEGCAGPVPAGFDLLHYTFQHDVVVAGRHPGDAYDALRASATALLQPWEQDDPGLIAELYLLHLVTALIESGDDQTRISRLDDWLRPVLAGVARAGASR